MPSYSGFRLQQPLTASQTAVLDLLSESGGDLDLNNNKIVQLASGSGAQDAAAVSQAGGDARTIYTRTFEITLAQLQAVGATSTHTWSLMQLGPHEAIRWVWAENTGAAFTGVGGLYIELGRSGSAGTLYGSTNIAGSSALLDDNSSHGADFGIFKGMGEKKTGTGGGDGTTYYGQEEDIECVTMTTSGNHDDLLGGGPLYFHLEIVRVDTTQIESVTGP